MSKKSTAAIICGSILLVSQISNAQPPPPSSAAASRATRESDQFGAEKERQIQKELKKSSQKPSLPEFQEEKPKPGEKSFFLKNIELSGCESFPPEDFKPLVAKYENTETTITGLNNLAKEIASEYLRRGIIAAVFLPPQEIKDGSVKIQVVEAKMGEAEIGKAPFFGKKIIKYYWRLRHEKTLRYDEISKSLQMMNKNPDREVKAALHAGDEPGTTDVILTSKTRFPIHGQYTFDREGIITTGKLRNGFGLRNNNFLGYDDTLISGLSFGEDFHGSYIYHSIPVSPDGASLLYGYSYSLSTPQKDFAVYGMKSVSENATASIRQDIYNKDEYVGDVYVTFDSKDKVTWYKSGTGTLNRDRLRELTFGADYMIRGAGSTTSITPELNQGINAFGASKADNPLSSRPGATPTYTKFSLSVQNRTALPFNLQQNLKLRMQLPSEKLFSQEQFGLGGIDTVRGYPPSDYLADTMALLNAEMLSPIFFLPDSWKLPYADRSLKEQLTAVAFFDYGYGEQRGNTFMRRLASVGAGLRISLYNQVLLRLEWGFPVRPMGQDPITEGYAPSRFHISLNVEDKLPEEITRIVKEMREERMRNEATAIIDAELADPNSPINKKMLNYLSSADEYYKTGKLKESRQAYAMAINMGRSLEIQAREYINGCAEQYDTLGKMNEEAVALYSAGKIEDAKKIWMEIKSESNPRPLELII